MELTLPVKFAAKVPVPTTGGLTLLIGFVVAFVELNKSSVQGARHIKYSTLYIHIHIHDSYSMRQNVQYYLIHYILLSNQNTN